MGPIRKLGKKAYGIDKKDIPPISYKNIRKSFQNMRPRVAPSDLTAYIEWSDTYGNKLINADDSYESDTSYESS